MAVTKSDFLKLSLLWHLIPTFILQNLIPTVNPTFRKLLLPVIANGKFTPYF
jgi:hypothetical protein